MRPEVWDKAMAKALNVETKELLMQQTRQAGIPWNQSMQGAT